MNISGPNVWFGGQLTADALLGLADMINTFFGRAVAPTRVEVLVQQLNATPAAPPIRELPISPGESEHEVLKRRMLEGR